MKNIVSFSGGKDSTALLLMMLEKGMQVDEAVFFDTEWEFPQMYEHIDKVEAYTGMKITVLKAKFSFDEYMLENHRTKGKRMDMRGGLGWPTARARWCTSLKAKTIAKHLRQYDGVEQYIGIAADEAHRCKGHHYPLVEWGVTEADALAYCKERGFDWGGLYDHFKRVSCFCCPLQPIGSLRALRREYPSLWDALMLMDMAVARQTEAQTLFRKDYTVPQLEQRFRDEDAQVRIPWEAGL